MDSVIVPPLHSKPRRDRMGTAYDFTCWALRFPYHDAPRCERTSSIPLAHFEWTTKQALSGDCQLPDFSPAQAARAWLRRHGRLSDDGVSPLGGRPLTLHLWGSSFSRELLEAILCRWGDSTESSGMGPRDGLTDGYMMGMRGGATPLVDEDGVTVSARRAHTRYGLGTVGMDSIRDKGGSCRGLELKPNATWNRERLKWAYPPEIHGVNFEPKQSVAYCLDDLSCFEWGTPTVLRLCYAFYGINPLTFHGASDFPFCAAGNKWEDSDVFLTEQDDNVFMKNFVNVNDPKFASCRREPGRVLKPSDFSVLSTFQAGPKAGGPLGLRPFVNTALARAYAESAFDPAVTQALCDDHGGEFCPPVMPASGSNLQLGGRWQRCNHRDPHPYLPGAPDLYAKAYLAMLATAA